MSGAFEEPALVPPPPAAAVEVFGAALPLVERYAQLLADEGVTWGLLGPREVPRLWSRHLLNSGVLTELIPSGASVADLGSGAGLPGIVIALMRADLTVTLIEPLDRRTRFLSLCQERLALADRMQVVRARAEDLHGRSAFDVVLARAVAPLGRLVGWAVPLTKPGGTVMAVKGGRAPEEVRAAQRELRRLGVQAVEVVQAGSGVVDVPTTVVRIVPAARRRPSRGG